MVVVVIEIKNNSNTDKVKMSNNNEKYTKAMELLAQWSYESKVRLAVMYVDGAEWKLACEIVPQPPPLQSPPSQQQVQLRVTQQPQQETPTILQEPVQTAKKGKKGKGKKSVEDNRYEAFVATIRQHMTFHKEASVRSCELTEEVNKYLAFKMSNNTTVPQYMKRFMEENPGIKRVNTKSGVVYKGLGRRGLEVAKEEKRQEQPVEEKPKFKLTIPKMGIKKEKQERECNNCTDKSCEKCQEITYDYSMKPKIDTTWTSGYSKPASTMTYIRMQ